MIKFIIFDLSEVCINGLSGFHEKIAQITGRSFKLIKNVVNDKIKLVELFENKISEDEYWDFVLSKLNINITKSEIKKIVRHNFIFGRYEETHKIIKDLRSKGVSLYILSDHALKWINYQFNKYGDFYKLFDKTYFSFDLKVTKLSPKIFELVLLDLGSDGSDVLFIDDCKQNLDIAKQAGIANIELFSTAEKLRERLRLNYNLL
jgi:putative hydrolase of the HAD superfamily